MNTRSTISDEQLTAYLDNEMDEDTAKDITRALKHDLELQDRIANLNVDKSDLVTAFDGLLEHAPASPKPETQEATTDTFSRFASLAATVLICLSLGWTANNYFDKSTPQLKWRDYAAAYQALYINRTLSHIQQSDSTKLDELKRVSMALGKDIALDGVNNFEELDYKRAQILGYQGQPLIQLAFLSPVDAPIALCIMRVGQQPRQAVKLHEREGMSSASWRKEGYAYLLIGGTDNALIERAAHAFSAYL